jgi:tRNA threonylcarbamoyladenosine biosynthesis protein TsaB
MHQYSSALPLSGILRRREDIIIFMKVLSVETSTMLGGAAIVDETNGLVAEIKLNVKITHSERLMSAIDAVLRQSDLALDAVDAFAVAIGPGSFTGLRIGLSTVKGLSYATGRPIVTVPTLDAFALNFSYSVHPVCLMLDARKSEVYAAVFTWRKDCFERTFGERSVRPEELLKELRGTMLFAGEGVNIYAHVIRETMGNRAIMASADKMVPSPANVAVIGLAKALRKEFSEPSEAVPLYIRKSEAEVKWSQKN